MPERSSFRAGATRPKPRRPHCWRPCRRPPAREGARLGPIFDRMLARLPDPQSIPSLAAEVGMSERTFLRRFRAAAGCTPREWILQHRLAQAKELLETSGRSIEDVAASCG